MPAVASALPAFEVVALHGSLTADEQDRAIAAGAGRRVILATNIAETSLTVPDVDVVIDSGLHKVARYDAARGIDSLSLERIPVASADQRAGRAARLGSGRARPALGPRAIGCARTASPTSHGSISRARCSTCRLGRRPTRVRVVRGPAHGRVRSRVAAARTAGRRRGPDADAARPPHATASDPSASRPDADRSRWRVRSRAACALLAERAFLPQGRDAVSCDLLPAIDAWHDVPPHIQQVARDIEATAADVLGSAKRQHIDEDGFRRAIFEGYADRVARRREERGRRLVLASGMGAMLSPESGVDRGSFWWRSTFRSWRRPRPVNARASRMTSRRFGIASLVERDWLAPTSVRSSTGSMPLRPRQVRRGANESMRSLSRNMPIEPEEAAALVAEACLARGPRDDDVQIVRRLRFAGTVRRPPGAREVGAACAARTLDAIDLAARLSHDQTRATSRGRRTRCVVPSGRRCALCIKRMAASARLSSCRSCSGSPKRLVSAPGRPRRLPSARAERPAGSNDARFAELLDRIYPGGAQRAARAVSEAPLARGSLDRDADANLVRATAAIAIGGRRG